VKEDALNAHSRTADPVAGRTVVVRVDLDHGISSEDGREIAALAARGARVAVVAGFGNPGGDVNPALSLEWHLGTLRAMTGCRVTFVPDCVGMVAEAALDRVPFGEIALMENLRFHPDARRDSASFAVRLAVLGDYFAVCGHVSEQPIGWLSALRGLLPAPPAAPVSYEALTQSPDRKPGRA
jgi:3-phosphoglycerate kinase